MISAHDLGQPGGQPLGQPWVPARSPPLLLHIEAIVRENGERTEMERKSESLGKVGLGGRRLQEVFPPPLHLFVSCPNPRLVLTMAAPHARAHAPSPA